MNTRIYLLLVMLAVGTLFGVYLLNKGSASRSGDNSAETPKKVFVWFGYVDLRHGPTALSPAQPGRIAKLLVQENQDVAAGAPLLALDDALAKLRVQEAAAALEIAQKQLVQSEKLPAQFRAKVSQQQSVIVAFDHRIITAEALHAVKKDLRKRGLINEEEVTAGENQIKELKALRSAEVQKLAELKLADPNLDVDIARKQVDRRRAQRAQAQKALEECTLQAPEAGTVMRILVNPGEVLGAAARQPALIFAPHGPRIIRAEVEQEFADLVQAGQTVAVEDDTNVEPIGRGKVTTVSNWFLPRRFQLEDPTQLISGRTLQCIIALDPGHGPLRIGQRVRVRIGP